MIEKRNEDFETPTGVNPLKSLTAAQFAALGGSAVAFIRPVRGNVLSDMIEDADFEDQVTYQLVMSADGTPLLVADTPDTVAEWLSDKNVGLVSLH